MATRDDVINWLINEFAPITLATPDVTLSQIVDNAVRYWNNYSAYKYVTMVSATSPRVEVDAGYNMVAEVYPASKQQDVITAYPIWSLLGIQVLGGVSSDLIMLSAAYNDYKVYLGKDFQWTFERSDDTETTPNYLYVSNVPSGVSQLCVVGAKRLLPDWDEPSSYVIDWIQRYSKALLKQTEGNLLRKSDIVGVKNDGQVLVDEGKEEMKDLQKELAETGRWLAMAKRF